MRGMRWRNVFLWVCFGVLLGSTSFAETSREGWTLSPMAGAYIFDEAPQGFDDGPVLGLRLGYLFWDNWGLEGQLDYIHTDGEDDEGNGNPTVFGAHLDLLYRFMPEQKLVPYVAAGGGGLIIKFDGRNHKVEDFINYGAGVNYYIDDSLALRLDARHILTYERDDWGNVGEQSFSVMAGVTFHLQKSKKKAKGADSDDDGIIDALDRCPGSPPGVSVDEDGCVFDEDGDGIPDYRDICPGTREKTKVNQVGCPEEAQMGVGK